MARLLTAVERRGARRRRAAHLGFATPAVLRPGVAVAVVELSAGGALVESSAPVRPGIATELGLDAFDGRRHAIRVRVIRCWVSALDPIRYRCAVRFDDVLTAG